MADSSAKSTPHYAKPITSQRLPEYTNEEQDRVRNAFHPGSYQSISALPPYVNPDFVSRSRVSMLEGQAHNGGGHTMKCGRAPAFFMEYEYMSEPFGLADELRSQERAQKAAQVAEIAGGETVFKAPGVLHKAKHEGNYPYIPEPYDAYQDEQMRQKWIEEKKILAGPFIPGTGKGVLEKPSRAMLTDIMTHLYRILSDDWEEAQPTVFTTEEDLIVVYFNLKAIKNPDGIKSYMNVFALRNDAVCSYDLRKVTEGWGTHTEDNHLMFALRPPWVRTKAYMSGGQATAGGSQQGEASPTAPH